MVWLVIDILLALCMALMIFTGYRQGLLGSLLRLAGFFVAVAAAAIVSAKCAPYVYSAFIKTGLVEAVAEQIASNPTAADLIEAINTGIVGILMALGVVGSDSIAAAIADLAGSDAAAMSEQLVEKVLQDPVTAIVRAVLFVVALVVAFALVKLIMRLFIGVNSVPLLGPVNRLLGSLFGLLQGALIDYIVVRIISGVLAMTAEGTQMLDTLAVNKTILFSFFYRL